MYNKNSRDGYRSTIKGIKQKTLVYGQNTLMAEIKMLKGDPNSNAPAPSRADRVFGDWQNTTNDKRPSLHLQSRGQLVHSLQRETRNLCR
jgi:D-Tyr-tRNAtyr deacylase